MSIRDRIRQERFASEANEAWVSVIVAADHLSAAADEVFAQHGVTGDQYNVLRILRGARPGGLTRGEITGRLMRRAPDTTRMLDRLERGGLIERRRGSEDARTSVARITRRGLALLERADPELDAAMAAAMAPLSSAQLRQLSRLCAALVR